MFTVAVVSDGAEPDPSASTATARRLELATIGWNVLEVFVTIGLGIAAGSLALIAFGLDSIAEIFASGAVLWHLRGDQDTGRTRRALRMVAVAFFVLAAVLLAAGIRNLVTEHRPDESPIGIAYLAVTACVMFGLAVAKRRVSVEIHNHPLVHEARVTFLDGLLASAILLALVSNVAFGWWWTDPVAAILVAVIAIFEGLATPREHGLFK
jgi:divalent metal cation (Fe/Co/Zn/Cd) transporter